MVDDHPWQLSPLVSFVSKVLVPNYKSVVHLFLMGDHPRFGVLLSLAWWATILRKIGDPPLQLLPCVSFVSNV